jgi:hypothetical protein
MIYAERSCLVMVNTFFIHAQNLVKIHDKTDMYEALSRQYQKGAPTTSLSQL